MVMNRDDMYITLDMKKDNGELKIAHIGGVAYIKADAFPELLFSVHE